MTLNLSSLEQSWVDELILWWTYYEHNARIWNLLDIIVRKMKQKKI